MAANVNIVVNAQDRASGVLRKVRNAFGEILKVTLGIKLSQTLDRMGEAVRKFGTNSIDAAAELQMFQIGIETLIAREQLMKNTTMEVGDAFAFAASMSGDYISRLQDIALISPFQFTDVQRVVRQAMAFGFGAEEALSYARATLNVAAGVGATNDMLRRMAYNLAQIRLQGKVTKLDIRQLALAGFDLEAVLRHVGDQMEVEIDNYEDFNKALKTGLITWADFTTGYADYADTYFGGASERMTRTFFGLKNTFKDVFAVTMPQILGPTLDAITDYTSHLLDLLIELRESGQLEAWGAEIKEAFDEKIKPVFDFLLYGITDRDNPVVRLLNLFRHLKEEGFFGKTWEYIFEQMTGIDLTPLQDALQIAMDIIASIRDEGLLSTGTLTLLDQLFGLESGTLANIKDTIQTLIDDVKAIIDAGFLTDEGLSLVASLIGMDPQILLDIKSTVEDVILWFTERWEELEPYFGMVGEAIRDNLLPFLEGLGLVLGYIAITVLPLLVPLFEKLADWMGEHAEDFAYLSEESRKLGMILLGIVYVAFRLIWSVLEPLLLGIADLVLLFGDLGLALATGDLESIPGILLEVLDTVVTSLKGAFSGLIEEVMQLIFGEEWTWEAFLAMWEEIDGLVFIILTDMLEKIKTWFSEEWTELQTIWENWWGPIRDSGDALITEWIEGAKAGWSVFTEETLPGWLAAIKEYFQADWLDQFIASGADLMAGIAQGFVEGFEDAKTTFKTAIENIVRYIRTLLKMESPSEVFAELGFMSMAGFLKGFGDEGLIKAGFSMGSMPAMAGAGSSGQQIVINNHYHGLTLNDRLQAERDLRPIVEKLTR